MSEINAIATNNFILHNIDAKKLYVQEPLFTANSGDAVYVGWRPDETVLWSGEAAVTTAQNVINLSESMYNFNSIKVYDRSFSNTAADAFATTITEVSMLPAAREIGTSDTWMDFYNSTASASHYFGRNYYSANDDGTKLVTLGSYIKSVNSTAAYSYRGAGKIFKVIGINRKENV